MVAPAGVPGAGDAVAARLHGRARRGIGGRGAVQERAAAGAGVDYDAAYIRKGLRVVDRAGLAARVALRCGTGTTHPPERVV